MIDFAGVLSEDGLIIYIYIYCNWSGYIFIKGLK